MSKLEVDAIEPQSGTTLTIGDSGDTINLVGTLQSNGSPLPGDISSVVAGTGLSGGGTTGAVTINIDSAQPTITSLGTITSFRSTGIDDNATSTAITITSGENIGINTTAPDAMLHIMKSDAGALLDSDADDLLIENNGNTGLTIGSSTSGDGNIRFSDSGDADVGEIKYNHSDNSLRFRANASERVRITSAGKVGIGTASPEVPLSVLGSDTQIHFNESSASSGGYLMSELAGQFRISGGAGFKVGGSDWMAKSTEAAIIGHDSGGDIKFFSNTSLTVGNSFTPTERMRLDSSGNLLVGVTSTSQPGIGNTTAGLSLRNSGGGSIASSRDGDTAGYFNRNTNDGSIISIRKAGTEVGSLETAAVSSSGRLIVKSTNFDGFLDRAGTTIAKWMSSSFTPGADNTFDLGRSASERWKDIYLSGGAFIGGTGTANKLDDYEEGTWTPSVTFGNGNTGVSSGASSGSYTKVGRLVNASGLLLLGSKGSSTGHARITGLPFAAGSGNSMNGAVIFGYIERISFSEVLLGLVNTSSTTVNLYEAVSGNVTPNAITNSDFNNSTAFRFTVTYQTN